MRTILPMISFYIGIQARMYTLENPHRRVTYGYLETGDWRTLLWIYQDLAGSMSEVMNSPTYLI